MGLCAEPLMGVNDSMDSDAGATFSPCRRYRYSLWRRWTGLFSANNGYAMFIGLNPSTADEVSDDSTIRRCIGFARAWGYDGLLMANLFAYRATKPAEMLAQRDPVGPDNDATLLQLANAAGLVVAAWGALGGHRDRATAVQRMLLPRLWCLGVTKAGEPSHPLYLPKSCVPVPWPCSALDGLEKQMATGTLTVMNNAGGQAGRLDKR